MAAGTVKKGRLRAEFGDFQTPPPLAQDVCERIKRLGVSAASIVEPTCGRGELLIAALNAFPAAQQAFGLEINADYFAAASRNVEPLRSERRIAIEQGDFFAADWPLLFRELPEPILVIGNPPWVTNSELGVWNSSNVPTKSNFQGRRGIEALTGKSNFDISEWMLLRLVESLRGMNATIAVLCKTAVARKVLAECWRRNWPISVPGLFAIDAAQHFGAAVDAGLLVLRSSEEGPNKECPQFPSLAAAQPTQAIGWRDEELVADVPLYERWRGLAAEQETKWRSGIKHDCAKVFELDFDGSCFRNGFGDIVELERERVFPMLKSSDLASEHSVTPRRWMIVTQTSVGEDTAELKTAAPKLWKYLRTHELLLKRRASSIYRNRPSFSIFGVGPYSFSPWKVAISGLYKRFQFRKVGPHNGQPVVLDDTSYFLPCESEEEAALVLSLMGSQPAQEFLSSQVFWDSKRPITAQLLGRLDLALLAGELGIDAGTSATLARFQSSRKTRPRATRPQALLFG